MGEIKISEMNADASVGGGELIAVSDAGAPKRISVDNLKDYTVDAIEAISAGGSVTGADGVFILQGGVLKPVDIDLVAQHAIDTIWGKAAESAPDSADIIALKDGGTTEKTLTLALLAEYVRATTEAAILDISDLADGSGALTSTDYLLVTQGTTAKQVTLADINTAIYGALDTYITALSAVATSADTDVFYCIQGGVEKKVALSTIKTYLGNPVSGPETTTVNRVPQWSTTGGVLKDGLLLATTVGAVGDDDSVVSEQGIRESLDTFVYDHDEIGAALVDADTMLVDDGGAGTTQRKSLISRLWTYVIGKIQGLSAKTTAVSADILMIQDSAASNALKELTLANLKTFLDTASTYDSLWVPASSMTPSVTNGADSETMEYGTNDLTNYVLLFDGSVQDESAEFNVAMPESWDRGTVKGKVFWAPGHSDANASEYVRFMLGGVAISNDDPLDVILGTQANMDDQAIADDDLHVTPASSAITVAGTPALGDLVHFKLTRDYDYAGAGAAMDVDARVFGVLIQYAKDKAVAAW